MYHVIREMSLNTLLYKIVLLVQFTWLQFYNFCFFNRIWSNCNSPGGTLQTTKWKMCCEENQFRKMWHHSWRVIGNWHFLTFSSKFFTVYIPLVSGLMMDLVIFWLLDCRHCIKYQLVVNFVTYSVREIFVHAFIFMEPCWSRLWSHCTDCVWGLSTEWQVSNL